MNSRSTGSPSPSRKLSAVKSRAAEAQALRAALSTATSDGKQEVVEPQAPVPAFLLADGLAESSPQRSREELIAEAAYLRAAGRGFEPGHELDDWLAAEQLVDARLANRSQR